MNLDKLKIFGNKIIANQTQCHLSREAAKISALSSKDLLEKYKYLTGEDLGNKPCVLEKTKFEYSSVGAVLADNVKKKTNTNKVNIKKKQDKNLIYNPQHSFTKFKDIDEFYTTKKLRLTDDYQYESEEEEEKQQTSKIPDQREPPKKTIKDNASNFGEWVNGKETGINSEVFQKHFRYQRPSDMLKNSYKTSDKYKNSKLVNLINSGLNDLKKEIENMDEEEKEIERPSEIIDIAEKLSEKDGF